MTRALAVDGTEIEQVIARAGGPSADTTKGVETLRALETWLGKPLPSESAVFVRRPVELESTNAIDAQVPDASWLNALPDVEAWLKDLAKPLQGHYQAVCHFCGLYPIGVQLNRGDFMFAMLVLEPYEGERLGGVMYYDQREVGTWGASVSEFLQSELRLFWEARKELAGDAGPVLDLSDLRDCFLFRRYDPGVEPPTRPAIPEALKVKWDAHWRPRMANFRRDWICAFLDGRNVKEALPDLPTAAQWQEEKAKVAETHHDAMYWLLAHWLLVDEVRLAEALELARRNPSRLVAAVAAFVSTTDASARYVKQRETLTKLRRERAKK